MKCLHKYKWVKLHRTHIPSGKGVMGQWMKLAAQAAYRAGKSKYCGFINDVTAGEWVGGIAGVKAILEVKSKEQAALALEQLQNFGLIEYDLDTVTKRLSYRISDWVHTHAPQPTEVGQCVYAVNQYGFLCVPRNLTEKLVAADYVFEESDAWLDLLCHTVFEDQKNVLSITMPVIQYGKTGIVQTLDKLGARWKWGKTKVWRFFNKYSESFPLIKLPGSQGCVIANALYDDEHAFDREPYTAEVVRIISDIRSLAPSTHLQESDHDRLNRLLARYSSIIASQFELTTDKTGESRVALLAPITRTYLFPALLVCNAIKSIHPVNDCRSVHKTLQVTHIRLIRGP